MEASGENSQFLTSTKFDLGNPDILSILTPCLGLDDVIGKLSLLNKHFNGLVCSEGKSNQFAEVLWKKLFK